MKRLPLFILFILFSGLLAAGTESGTEYFRLKIQDIISPGPDKFSLKNESEITEAELLLKAEEEFSKMTLEEQVSLLFIIHVDGKDSLSDFSKTRLTEIQPGGVLLFGYNISDDPGTLINFISEIKSVSGAENPVKSPLVFLDHEGGWVNRLRNLTWALPSARDVYTNLSFSNQYILYSLQAMMLKLIGVDINLAPVAEPGTPFNNEFLDSRAPGEDISDAVIYSGIFVSAMESQGVGSVLKHFPGNTNKDPHKEIPVMEISKESFREILIPFKECTSLTNVVIPNSVTFLDMYVFQDCTSLISMVIPSSVTYIGSNAFDGSYFYMFCETEAVQTLATGKGLSASRILVKVSDSDIITALGGQTWSVVSNSNGTLESTTYNSVTYYRLAGATEYYCA